MVATGAGQRVLRSARAIAAASVTALLMAVIAGSAAADTSMLAEFDGEVREVAMQRQNARQDSARDTVVFRVDPLTVTATRTARSVFLTPAPVVVLDSTVLQRLKPNTVTELFRDVPGMDVTGVGVQQPRPVIRGQRGQRILLLADGLRLNNSRRQQDFGEVPALVDPEQVGSVEVVRGPSSVLYGTDAIGGVVNLITRQPTAPGLHGRASYVFGQEEDQHRGALSLSGVTGPVALQGSFRKRKASAYMAPAGSFGNIELDDATTVNGTGIEDWNASLRVVVNPVSGHAVFLRAERYESENAAFGYIDPAAYAPSQPRIDIRYPFQHFTRVTAGWSASALDLPFADRTELAVYAQDNERTLTFDLFQSFGPQAPPGAGLTIQTHNFSDLRTYGLRLEAKKLATPDLLFTYGVDAFRDRSENTDSSVTRVIGFGPPQIEVSREPQVPSARYRSVGAFAQAELTAGAATIIAGARVQQIAAEADAGQGVPAGLTSKSRSTVVGAANLLYALTGNLVLIGSVGRAFRAPNLIEWFFDGPTPEGNGYQVRSPDLEPETTVNIDLGARWRDRRIAVEAFVFRNEVRDGIRIAPTGDTIQGFPAFQNVNLDKLLFRGIELSAEALLTHGFALLGSYTRLDAEDELDPSNPIGDSYSSRVTGSLRYNHPADRFWAEYAVRHNGERKDVQLVANPLGDVLPAFTVHVLRGGVALPRRGGITPRIGIAIENLTDELYAESTNASFFRPEPRRRFTVFADIAF